MRAGHTPCIADLARLCHAIDSPLVFEVLPVTPDRALAH
jgi:hypothetical protein